MNISPLVAQMINDFGVESKHWCFVGAHDAKDIEIIEYAVNNNYVILTCDLDFSTILSSSRNQKPSVIQLRTQAIDVERVASMVANATMQNIEALLNGAIVTIDARKARIRLLPL